MDKVFAVKIRSAAEIEEIETWVRIAHELSALMTPAQRESIAREYDKIDSDVARGMADAYREYDKVMAMITHVDTHILDVRMATATDIIEAIREQFTCDLTDNQLDYYILEWQNKY